MAAMAGNPPQDGEQRKRRTWRRRRKRLVAQAQRVEEHVSPLIGFWIKINNDWIFNWSAMLAYVFMTSMFSIMLAIVAIGGLILGAIAPDSEAHLEHIIADAMPGGAAGGGDAVVAAATRALTHDAGFTLLVAVVLAIITGSGLFITLENAFGVIFRLRGRDPVRQRAMAIAMLLFYTLTTPIIILVSVVAPTILRALSIGESDPVGVFILQASGIGIAFLFALLLFSGIYVVVPNRPVRFREVWKGTVLATVLLVVYELLFPVYQNIFLRSLSYASTIGLILVILIFFYYFAFILLLGAEVNSWSAGQRQTAAPIDAILHEVQAHNTTRGAAGPTAGQPQEDLQNREGAPAMANTEAAIQHVREQHKHDQQPPRYAESGVTGHGYVLEGELKQGIPLGTLADDATQQEHEPGDAAERQRLDALASSIHAMPPLTTRQRATLAALVVAGAVALVPVARVVARLVSSDERE